MLHNSFQQLIFFPPKITRQSNEEPFDGPIKGWTAGFGSEHITGFCGWVQIVFPNHNSASE